jgi:hypothetical protein
VKWALAYFKHKREFIEFLYSDRFCVLSMKKKIPSVHLPIFQTSSKDPLHMCNFIMYADM